MVPEKCNGNKSTGKNGTCTLNLPCNSILSMVRKRLPSHSLSEISEESAGNDVNVPCSEACHARFQARAALAGVEYFHIITKESKQKEFKIGSRSKKQLSKTKQTIKCNDET